MAEKRSQMNIRISQEIQKKLAYIAREDRRSTNSFMEILLENYVKEYERKNGKIILEDDENPQP